MPSIAEIARCAEVSRCAASQILNRSRGYERFSVTVRDRVVAIASRLGWVRDSRGVALQEGKTGVMALSLNWQGRDTALMQASIAAIERAARQHDQYLLIIGGEIEDAVAAVHSHRCDGVMAIGWSLGPEDCGRLASCNHSVLFHVPEGLRGVELDIGSGLTRAVSYLHGLGHRRVLWLHADINEGHDLRWEHIRLTAGRIGMECQRMSFNFVGELRSEAEEVATMCECLVGRLSEIAQWGAVICYNELVGISLYAAAAGRLRIPEQLSIIGIDDIHAPLTVPPMTSISFPVDKMAEAALAQLLRPSGKNQASRVSSGFSVRLSTAPP